MKKLSELNGAWEEKNVTGTRIEIKEPKITVLWKNSPVLNTSFKKKERDGGVELMLKHRGLRYEKAVSDYAELTELFYKDGELFITKTFPITGESSNTLNKTENSRYGNYTIVDDRLSELWGEWTDENGNFILEFSKDTLSVNGRKTKIHILHSNYEYEPENSFKIVDQDPSVFELPGFFGLSYIDGKLSGNIIVLDAPPCVMNFKKIK